MEDTYAEKASGAATLARPLAPAVGYQRRIALHPLRLLCIGLSWSCEAVCGIPREENDSELIADGSCSG